MKFAIMNGVFVPEDNTCRSCKSSGMIECHPGDWPKCRACRSILMYLGRTPPAPCISPSGRIDGHGEYVKMLGDETVCAFCNESVK